MNDPRVRQQAAPTWSGNSGEGNDNHLAAGVINEGSRLDHQDLLDELDVITTAWINGYEVGRAHGLAAHMADVEAAATHRRAARVVNAVMTAPERDREADRAAAQRRADRYGQPTFGRSA